MDVRKAALVACMMSALALPIPVWNLTRTLIAVESKYSMWLAVPGMVLVGALTLTIPLFYFSLHLNKGAVLLSKRLQALSLVGALALGVATAISLIQSLGPAPGASVLTETRDPWTIGNISALLTGFSNLSCILLLIALSGSPTDESIPRGTVSKLLSGATTIAATVWGFCVAANLLRLIFIPIIYAQLRNSALQAGRTPPSLGKLAGEASGILLQQFGLFVAPYVVWRSCSKQTGGSTDSPSR
jgi:hypothetical protein